MPRYYRANVVLLFPADDHNNPGETMPIEGAYDVVTGLLSETLKYDGLITDWSYTVDENDKIVDPELVWDPAEEWDDNKSILTMPLYDRQEEFDHDKAEAEGWLLTTAYGTDDKGHLRIEKDDCAGVFDGDDTAAIHVINLARCGSHLHREALRRVKADNETEWTRLVHIAQGMGIRQLSQTIQ